MSWNTLLSVNVWDKLDEKSLNLEKNQEKKSYDINLG